MTSMLAWSSFKSFMVFLYRKPPQWAIFSLFFNTLYEKDTWNKSKVGVVLSVKVPVIVTSRRMQNFGVAVKHIQVWMQSPVHLPMLEWSVLGPPAPVVTLIQSWLSPPPWIIPQMFSRSKSHESRKVEPWAGRHVDSTYKHMQDFERL